MKHKNSNSKKFEKVLGYVRRLNDNTEEGYKRILIILSAISKVAYLSDIQKEAKSKKANMKEKIVNLDYADWEAVFLASFEKGARITTIRELLKMGYSPIHACFYYNAAEDILTKGWGERRRVTQEDEFYIMHSWDCPKELLDQEVFVGDPYQDHYISVSFQYDFKEMKLYYEYKRDWCIDHGYNPDTFDFVNGVNGEAPACMKEWFENDYIKLIQEKKEENRFE